MLNKGKSQKEDVQSIRICLSDMFRLKYLISIYFFNDKLPCFLGDYILYVN